MPILLVPDDQLTRFQILDYVVVCLEYVLASIVRDLFGERPGSIHRHEDRKIMGFSNIEIFLSESRSNVNDASTVVSADKIRGYHYKGIGRVCEIRKERLIVPTNK